MNYRIALMILGLLLFAAAMIPYAYELRCATEDCHPARPY